ncbi:hypothetical protein Pfra02_23340 [Pseudomonas fragi]|nr:hypothetical protein Pfra02_23340 [Pseudomonas fragi]
MNTEQDDDSTVRLPATGSVKANMTVDGTSYTFSSDSVTHFYNPSFSHYRMSAVSSKPDSTIFLWIKKGISNGVYDLGQANRDVYMDIRYAQVTTRATEGKVDIKVVITPERHHFQATFNFVAGQQNEYKVTNGELDISRVFELAK